MEHERGLGDQKYAAGRAFAATGFFLAMAKRRLGWRLGEAAPSKEGFGRFMAVAGGHRNGLRRPRGFHDSVQLTTDPAAFGCDFFTGFFVERYHEANEFEWSE
jgi:hypothetical protein